MVFNSINFLFFFPIVVLTYFLIPKRIRIIWLLISSYFFYMSWNPRYMVLIIFSTVVSYMGGRLIEKYWSYRRGILTVSIIANIFVLIIFKYTDFIVVTCNRILKIFGGQWHMSLSMWFRDYVYIPLGGNRCTVVRKSVNLMVTFLLSGLWHGAAWHYIVWGGIHGLYRVVEEWIGNFKNKAVDRGGVLLDKGIRRISVCTTFLLVCVAWTFFRAESTLVALEILKGILYDRRMMVSLKDSMFSLGLDNIEVFILFSAVAVLFFFDFIKYKKKQTIDLYLENKKIGLKWCILYALLFYIIVFGIYGPTFDTNQFIYFQF